MRAAKAAAELAKERAPAEDPGAAEGPSLAEDPGAAEGLSAAEAPAELLGAPETKKKPWMDYRSVTDENSPQYAILAEAEADMYGVLRWRGYVCVALGQSWGSVGDTFTFLIGGREVSCVMADAKMDEHTAGGEGWRGLDGHVLEVVVDSDLLHADALIMGDCNYIPYLEGEIDEKFIPGGPDEGP